MVLRIGSVISQLLLNKKKNHYEIWFGGNKNKIEEKKNMVLSEG